MDNVILHYSTQCIRNLLMGIVIQTYFRKEWFWKKHRHCAIRHCVHALCITSVETLVSNAGSELSARVW